MYAVNLSTMQFVENLLLLKINHISMRILSTLLHSSALLLLGASAIFCDAAANALTFNWSFNNTAGSTPGGTTSGTISGLTDGSNDFSVNTDIVVTILQSNNLTPVPIFKSLNDGTYSSSGTIVVDQLNAGNPVTSYNFLMYDGTGASLNFDVAGNSNVFDNFSGYDLNPGPSATTFTTQAVPAPLPILGIPAVLLYSRNLKKRIKARREISSSALA
jgi:hypothetical protein